MTAILINNLPLPEALVERLRGGGRWAAPSIERIRAVFGEKPSQAVFYSLEHMLRENEHWFSQTDEIYFGQADTHNPPGDIDPRKSVIIGDLGIDMPIALDYRSSVEPTVTFLGRRILGRWITVAPNVASLISQLCP